MERVPTRPQARSSCRTSLPVLSISKSENMFVAAAGAIFGLARASPRIALGPRLGTLGPPQKVLDCRAFEQKSVVFRLYTFSLAFFTGLDYKMSFAELALVVFTHISLGF